MEKSTESISGAALEFEHKH